MKQVDVFTTGYQRGYIKVSDRGVESSLIKVPDTLKGLRGNLRWAMESFMNSGATHYTLSWRQHSSSTQYCYRVFTGYRKED